MLVPEMSASKIDQVLQKLDTSLARVETMDTSINKFNERLSEVEKKLKILILT